MNSAIHTFGETAKGLARNPLGIIALFIVLVYGFASLVAINANSFTAGERLPLIYFLVFFPVLVLIAFVWLVSKHSDKLYSPSDFSDEKNYMKLRIATLLGAAAAKTLTSAAAVDMNEIVDTVRAADPSRVKHGERWRNRILWVDDRPNHNIFERQAFEAMGLHFTLAQSTDEAFEKISEFRYAAIISDMERREGPREGYVLLDRLREEGDCTPLYFYVSSTNPEHLKETSEHGGQGCTNNPQELFEMVTRAAIGRQTG